MKQTQFITPAMKELLIPSEGISNLFPDGLARLQKGDKSFFELQTLPHVGDMVVGLDLDKYNLFKVKQTIWTRNNDIRIAQDAGDSGYPPNRLYPIYISDEILIRLGFYMDERFNKFRLRLNGFRNIDIDKSIGCSFDSIGYIKEIGYIEYLHELQAILRVYRIDQGICNGQLYPEVRLPDGE